MDYLVSLLGNVAAHGLRADHAVRDLVERTLDEFACTVSSSTGLSCDALCALKARVMTSVLTGTLRAPGQCQGRAKSGVPCKKRALLGYCELHRAQEAALQSKRRRIHAQAARRAAAGGVMGGSGVMGGAARVVPMRAFQFS